MRGGRPPSHESTCASTASQGCSLRSGDDRQDLLFAGSGCSELVFAAARDAGHDGSVALTIESPEHMASLVEPFKELLAEAARQEATERGEAVDGTELAARMEQMRHAAIALMRNRIALRTK
jgi:hypothetical protein